MCECVREGGREGVSIVVPSVGRCLSAALVTSPGVWIGSIEP